MPDELPLEDGWPARDFDEDARAYLLEEGRQRVQAQLAHLRAQDVKVAALFTASAGLFALSGLFGDLRVEATPEAVLTFMGFFASLVAWSFLGLAYWTRDMGVGLDLEIVRRYYGRASRQELQDAALEALVAGFILNQQTIRAKTQWLQKSFFAVATQLLLLFAAIVAAAIASPGDLAPQDSTAAGSSQSGTVLVDGER